MYICADCNHEVMPNVHGRCSDCGSAAIALLDMSYNHGSRDVLLLRETSRGIDIIRRINEFKAKMALPSTN